MARLTPEQWDEVKSIYLLGAATLDELGERFGVSRAAIQKKRDKENWAKLDEFNEARPKKEQPSSSGFIYVVTFLDSANKKHYKIGRAKNIEQRLSGIQTGNPFKLKLDLCFWVESMSKVENMIHNQYKNKRKNGEWFDLTDSDVLDIAKRYSING